MHAYFGRHEFACNCGCGFDTVDWQLLNILIDLRERSGGWIKINSGCRCRLWNYHEGGSKNSWHIYGRAADVVSEKWAPSRVYDFIEEHYPHCGLGLYDTFTHIDTRGEAARWDRRTT